MWSEPDFEDTAKANLKKFPLRVSKNMLDYKKNLANRNFFKAYYDLGELAHIALYGTTNGLDEWKYVKLNIDQYQ